MGIHTRWDDAAHTILICEFDANWSLSDFHTMVDEVYVMMNSVNYRVYLIHDFSKSRVSPRQWLSTGSHIEKRQSQNSAETVVIGASTFVKTMLNIAQKLFLKNIRVDMADTLPEAYKIIESRKLQAKSAA